MVSILYNRFIAGCVMLINYFIDGFSLVIFNIINGKMMDENKRILIYSRHPENLLSYKYSPCGFIIGEGVFVSSLRHLNTIKEEIVCAFGCEHLETRFLFKSYMSIENWKHCFSNRNKNYEIYNIQADKVMDELNACDKYLSDKNTCVAFETNKRNVIMESVKNSIDYGAQIIGIFKTIYNGKNEERVFIGFMPVEVVPYRKINNILMSARYHGCHVSFVTSRNSEMARRQAIQLGILNPDDMVMDGSHCNDLNQSLVKEYINDINLYYDANEDVLDYISNSSDAKTMKFKVVTSPIPGDLNVKLI